MISITLCYIIISTTISSTLHITWWCLDIYIISMSFSSFKTIYKMAHWIMDQSSSTIYYLPFFKTITAIHISTLQVQLCLLLRPLQLFKLVDLTVFCFFKVGHCVELDTNMPTTVHISTIYALLSGAYIGCIFLYVPYVESAVLTM